jgi:hypothetical protein
MGLRSAGIFLSAPSLPGLTRQSSPCTTRVKLDARVKHEHDVVLPEQNSLQKKP